MTNDIITLIANLALALSFIVALIFGIAQVKAAARDRRERLTLETLRNFQTREFAELMHYIIYHNMPANRNTTAWEKYKKMVLDTREKQPDPFLAEYFQWLAERIDERMKENPRKPFHETRLLSSDKVK